MTGKEEEKDGKDVTVEDEDPGVKGDRDGGGRDEGETRVRRGVKNRKAEDEGQIQAHVGDDADDDNEHDDDDDNYFI